MPRDWLGSTGPLKRRILETGPVDSSRVALLGDASAGDINEGLALAEIYYLDANNRKVVFINQGELMGESFNDGPAQLDAGGVGISILADFVSAPNLALQLQAEMAGGEPAASPNWTWLQDTRDWSAVHGNGTGSCNMLFADGSVREYSDQNQDKYLNPGFQLNPATPNLAQNVGYTDGLVELPNREVYNGIFLQGFGKATKFEK